MKKLLLLLLFATVISNKIYGQGEVPVSMYTGAPQITVPLGSVSSYDLSVPIYMAYDATGIRVQQPSGIYGLGWNLVAGGSISRQVKGIPDDQASPRGWIYASAAPTMASDVNTNIVPFTNTNACPVTDSNEIAVQTKLSSYYASIVDTEPDVFSFSFGGYSGKFVFDNGTTPTIHLIPWQDIKIVPTQNASQTITSFTATTNDGVQYTFDQVTTEIRKTVALDTSRIKILERDFYSYQNSTNLYNTEWKLTKMTSPSGGQITFSYASSQNVDTDTVRVSVRNAPPSTLYTILDKYTDTRTTTQLDLFSVSGLSGNSATMSSSAITFSDPRRSAPLYKTFALGYSTVTSDGYPRMYLETVTESSGSGCDQKPPYVFQYLNGEGNSAYLPPPWSKGVDFWGYSNGNEANINLVPTIYVYPGLPVQERFRIVPLPSYGGTTYTLPGANRSASAVGVMAGTLNSIKYPAGGVTTIVYEPNQYYDAQLGQSVMGGGIRIKSFTYFDGMSSNSITKFFTYTDSLGNSTGRLISRPMFAAPTLKYYDPVAHNSPSVPAGDWSYEVIRSEKDLSAAETTFGSAVGYLEVTVTRPNSGKARYQYLVPGTYGTTAAGAWAPATDGFARSSSSCPNMLDVITSASAWQFPYARNPEFDYERGLAWQVREYDNSGKLVRKTRTNYQYVFNIGGAPNPVYGLQYERFPNGPTTGSNLTFLFSKYNFLTDAAKVVANETVKIYNTGTSDSVVNVTAYTYSNTHHLLTQVKSTTPDGTVYVANTRYPKDYASNGIDMASQMIAALQANRNGTVIEQYSYQKKPGQVKKYTGGSLVKFSNFGGSNPMLQYMYKLNLGAALTSFDSSYVDPGTLFFHSNSNYDLAQTVNSYDSYGNAQTSVAQSQVPVTTAWGFNGTVPVVSARNASFGQFAFSDFETTTGAEFTVFPNFMGAGRTGDKALWQTSATLTSKTLQKGASTYTLSLWLKNASATTVHIAVKNTAQTTTYYTVDSVWTSAGSFKYFEAPVPIDPSLSSFVLVVTATANSAYLIDDVGFYPAGSDLTTSTYTLPFGPSAVTANGNVTNYTVYDGLGRPKYTLDTYQNIREKYTYRFAGATDPVLTGGFTGWSHLDLGTYDPPYDTGGYDYVYDDGTLFTASDACVDGVTYTWTVTNNGVQSTPITTTSPTQTLTFPAMTNSTGWPYTATIKLTVTHPVFGTATQQRNVKVLLRPFQASSCARGAWSVCTNDHMTGTVTSTYPNPCADMVDPGGMNTNFEVTGANTGETIASYQWQMMVSGASSWVSSGPTTQKWQNVKADLSTNGYSVRCLVTTTTGRIGFADVMVVTVTTCN